MLTSGEQVLFRLEKGDSSQKEPEPDLLLLDIHMSGIDGMQLARKLRKPPYDYCGEIIFITVAKEFAISAFDVKAYHYIVKNETSDKKVQEVFRNVMKEIEEKKEEFLVLKGIGEVRRIPVSKIFYFEVNHQIVTAHYGEDESFEFRSTIAELENVMLPYRFLRIHRSFLVAVDQIFDFTYTTVTLNNEEQLPIGRKYVPVLKNALGR